MMRIITAHNILKGFFWYNVFACADILFLKKIGLQKTQIWPKMAISLFWPFWLPLQPVKVK